MSFSQTFAYSVARAVDVATASVFTKHTDCTISTLCEVALQTQKSPFLQALGKALNWIQKGHTASALQSDYDKGQAIVSFLAPHLKPSR